MKRKPSPFALRALRLAFLFLLTAHCSLLTAFGQSATATLSGTIEDQNGALVPGATVTVKNGNTGLSRETTTNEAGFFTVALLPPGTYTIRAQHDGFTTAEIRDVILNVGDQKAFQVQLKTGNISETVNVTAETPLVNESPAVSTVVDRQFVANMPLNGRSFQSLISLTPGAVLTPSVNGTNFDGQFSINGQRASANAFTVDGVSANFGAAPGFVPGAQTSGNLPGLTAFGSTQSLVSVDALQEFKVQTSSYSAEYGRQPGGQISIITRSGTNDFHGSLFDYIRNDVFDANDWFANASRQQRPPERQNDFGGTFSGPVLLPRFGEGGHQPGYNGRNRTFFFFSYEGLRLRLPKFALTNVPTLCLRGRASCPSGQNSAPAGVQPILNAFPLPNGRNLGNGLAEYSASYSEPSGLDAASIRVDHSFSSKLTLFGRYSQTPSYSDSRPVGNLSLISSRKVRTKTITLGSSAFFTPQFSNEIKVNYSDNYGASSTLQDTFGGAIPVPRNVFVLPQYESATAQGGANLPFPGRTSTSTPFVSFVDSNVNSQRQFNIVDNISFNTKGHQFKFGVDFRRLTPTYNVNSYQLSAVFQTVQQVQNSAAGTATVSAGLPVKPIYTNFSAFAQDRWMLSRRLTLDLGVRWDVNPPPGEASGNLPLAVTEITDIAAMRLTPRGAKLWSTTYNNFAPRIGVAYQVRQNPGYETILRGGFGSFYDTGNDFSSYGFSLFPFNVRRTVTNLAFPLIPSQVAPSSIPALQSSIPSPFDTFIVFDPALKTPYTLQWNVAVEQSIGKSQTLTVSYVGAAGRRLLQAKQLRNLSSVNSLFTNIFLVTNKATSGYNALQGQFQRRLSHGLQALASYTWSHAIDEDSTSFSFRQALRGNASFDLRHSFAAAITYDIPSGKEFGAAKLVFAHWAVDSTIRAQTSPPIDIIARFMVDPADGQLLAIRPNLITGVPVYIDDSSSPGGRRINRAAFSVPSIGQSGNLGRNIIRGLPAWQVDIALRRQFTLWENMNLQFRAEAFNVFNHPNFGDIQTNLSTPSPPTGNFGQATNMMNRQLGGLNPLYQIGGPRSFQFALKLLY